MITSVHSHVYRVNTIISDYIMVPNVIQVSMRNEETFDFHVIESRIFQFSELKNTVDSFRSIVTQFRSMKHHN